MEAFDRIAVGRGFNRRRRERAEKSDLDWAKIKFVSKEKVRLEY